MEIRDVVCLERDRSLQHGIKQDSQTPDVSIEALIAFIDDNLRSKIGWRSALLLDDVVLLDESTHTEVTKLHASFAIHQHIVKLDVSMQNASAVTVAQTV